MIRASQQPSERIVRPLSGDDGREGDVENRPCLLYTSEAADERSSVDLGG